MRNRLFGVDITDYAVKSTRDRLRLMGLKGDIIRIDAEHMGFPDNSFDFVWSWGVIHHSSNTENVLREILRVLRQGYNDGLSSHCVELSYSFRISSWNHPRGAAANAFSA
jgi:ubiquinone/menaquinone biosynthesis C-methylase UbiE